MCFWIKKMTGWSFNCTGIPEYIKVGLLSAPDIHVQVLLAVVSAEDRQWLVGTDDELIAIAIT